jgi:hypothetical protein
LEILEKSVFRRIYLLFKDYFDSNKTRINHVYQPILRDAGYINILNNKRLTAK